MDSRNLFEIGLKRPVCLSDFSEDSIRAFVDALQVAVSDDSFGGVVLSSQGVSVKFVFGPDGNFSGVTAKLDGKDITLIPGVGQGALQIFEGKPTSIVPGAGWEVVPELTRSLLNQPVNQDDWEAFIARRVGVLNTITTP
jgi:hypothetical protein